MSKKDQEFSKRKYPKVSIVIPTYNRKKDVLECLESLQSAKYPNYEIVVVDNGSIDGTAEAIKNHFPHIKLIMSPKNLGVTGGRNLGAKHSNGEYTLFLDHDTIVDKNMLSELVLVMQDDIEIGLAGPLIYYYEDPKRIWAAGTSISLFTGKVSFNMAGLIDVGQLEKVMNVQVLPTAFIMRREVIEKVGLFDETFFAVYEDTDFCYRVREAGYKVVCVSTARVWHKVSPDEHEQVLRVLERAYYVARNRVIFMRKHANPLNLVVFLLVFQPIYTAYYTAKVLQLDRLDCLREFWQGAFSGFLWQSSEACGRKEKWLT